VGLSVFGFQQSLIWSWSNPLIGLSIAVGVGLLVAFVLVELRTKDPLMQVRIFAIRAFGVENLVLGISMLVFVPFFFFASEYAQVALDKTAQEAGLYLLYFFLGFVVASQIGGRVLDRRGAKRPVTLGCGLAALGFFLWAGKVTDLSFSSQIWFVILAGFGMGLMLTPASTDAVNRAGRLSYGEATGITQTVRNYAASLGLAILGTILVSQFRSRVTNSLVARGVGHSQAAKVADGLSEAQGASGTSSNVPHFIRLDFAYASRTVFYVMAGIMAVAALVALFGLVPGRQEQTSAEPAEEPADQPGVTAPEGGR
jgi:fucose permease